MNILDRITLAKAGYKKADIEKMIEAEQPEEVKEEKEIEVINEDKTEDNELIINNDNETDEEASIKEDELKDEVIEELQNKVLELEQKLSNAQTNNINTDRNIENPIEKAEKKLFDVIANFS